MPIQLLSKLADSQSVAPQYLRKKCFQDMNIALSTPLTYSFCASLIQFDERTQRNSTPLPCQKYNLLHWQIIFFAGKFSFATLLQIGIYLVISLLCAHCLPNNSSTNITGQHTWLAAVIKS